jgi:hypothetical protein
LGRITRVHRLEGYVTIRSAIPALAVVVAGLAGACGGDDDEGGAGHSVAGTADY